MNKLLVSVFVFFSLQLSAQIKITGKIITNDNKPLEFAEIIVLNKDSMGIKSELTNEDGTFLLNIPKGLYTMQVRQFNKIFFSKIMDSQMDMNLGEIKVDHVAGELQSVIIEVKDKLIERKLDRLVFNVENSIKATGGDALDVLKIAPGVSVQNEKITMIGKNTLSVMIDDKIVQLSESELANYLQSIPADLIKSIEVITTPPAKYDATGSSGYVNIKLKKNEKNAWSALIGSAYLQRVYGDGSVLGNFSYNKNKLNFSSSLNYKNGSKYVSQYQYSYFNDGLWATNFPYKTKYYKLNGTLSLDYQLTSRWAIGSQFLLNQTGLASTLNSQTTVSDYEYNETIRFLQSHGKEIENPEIKSLNLYNEFKIDSLGRKIIINLDRFYFNNDDATSYIGTSFIKTPYSQKYFTGENTNSQNIVNLSGKLDVEFPMKLLVLNFGVKVSNSTATNGISYFNSGIIDSMISGYSLAKNRFEYSENVEVLYLSANKKINSSWESQAGLRMESTQTEAFAVDLNMGTKNNYIKFFPTAYLSYTPTDHSRFIFSYSRRINRPAFYRLNPNVFYVTPFQTIEGNPFLQPAFIDNLELIYTYRKLESKLYMSYEDNLVSQIPIADPTTNIIRFTNENCVNTQRYGISENYIYDKLKWWTSNNSVDFNYAISKTSLLILQKEQKAFNSRISTSNDFALNSSKTILFNVSYWYRFVGIEGIYKKQAMSSLSFAIQYLLLDKDLKISLKGSDLFRAENDKGSSTVNGIYQEFKYYYDTQSVMLSLSYKIGNKKIKTNQRDAGNIEERRRTGN